MNAAEERPGKAFQQSKPDFQQSKPETKWYIAVSGGVETRAILFVFPPEIVVLTSPNSTSTQTFQKDESGREDFEVNGEGEFLFVDPYRSKHDGGVANIDRSQHDIDRETEAFLDRVYDLANEDEPGHAIDVIFQHMNWLLMERRAADCDEILSNVQLTRIPPVLMAAFLTITAAARKDLKNRPVFFANVRRLVEAQRGTEGADRLLVGLS